MVASATQRAALLPDERRASPRVRVGWKVKAIPASGGSIIPCTVLDVSDGGARLSVPTDPMLPERFHLYFPLRNLSQFTEVKWRGGAEIGVAFIDGSEVEIRDLRNAIAHLTERLQLLERLETMRVPAADWS